MKDLYVKIIEFLPFYGAKIDKQKKRIRHEMRELRGSLSLEQKQAASDSIFNKIESMSEFKDARTILIYWSTKNEVPTHDVVRSWSKTKKILLPSVDGSHLKIKPYVSEHNMKQGNLGIMEPDTHDTYEDDIDLVIVPAVAFDNDLNRLGRGKGFYDKYFHRHDVYKIGVGYDFQLVNKIPAMTTDAKMDKVVTPNRMIE
jgi:5-formyltetrahydrofolate cyclo-ligase